MSTKTIILIIVLSVIAGIAVFIAMSPKNETPQPSGLQQPTPAPNVAFTTLSLLPNSLTISTPSASVDVSIDTKTNKVTAVQLEISYDPKKLTNVDIVAPSSGGFFENPIVLLKKIDEKKGLISFALAISASQTAKMGTGNVATISFTSLITPPGQTEIKVLPETLVTAEGISSSVLKSSSGTTIIVPIVD